MSKKPSSTRELWDQVQARLVGGRSSEGSSRHEGTTPMLAGLVFDETGDRLTPTHATKKGRRYEYYVSTRLIEKDADDQDGWRLPAHKLERAVRDCLLDFLSNKVAILDAVNQHDGNFGTSASSMNQILKSANELIEKIRSSSQLESVHEVRSIVCSDRFVSIEFEGDGYASTSFFMAEVVKLDIKVHNAAADTMRCYIQFEALCW